MFNLGQIIEGLFHKFQVVEYDNNFVVVRCLETPENNTHKHPFEKDKCYVLGLMETHTPNWNNEKVWIPQNKYLPWFVFHHNTSTIELYGDYMSRYYFGSVRK